MSALGKTRIGLPKHETLDALLGSSADHRPRRTRLVEWVGEPSPLDDPLVARMVALRRFPPDVIAAIRLAAARANTRTGARRRVMEQDGHPASLAPVPGLGRTYVWSPQNHYLQHVDHRDVDVLLSGPCGHEFRDVTDAPDRPGRG